jgi:Cytochrome c3
VLSFRWAWIALALLAAGAGCARKRTATADPHHGVACVGCHRGGATPSGNAGVPDLACSSRACHPNGGPDTAHIAMVSFRHSAHPMSANRTVPCAACHTHDAGSTVLKADVSTCALCHFPQISGPRDAGCATCHPQPRHTAVTSQGVPLSHAMLRTARVPCTRCHYRVVEGDTTVAVARCAACHKAKPPVKLPPADSAHAHHPDLSCRSCHSPISHRVIAMSGSIVLECLDCHSPRHRRPMAADTSRTAKCADCHAGVHAEQQRLMLGLMPGEELRPSLMFMGGVTCRSCHVAPDAPRPTPGASLKPASTLCVGCHGPAWKGVLERWERGYQRRRGWIDEYLRAAETGLGAGAPASALAQLAQARGVMAFVQRAKPAHNLAAADQIMRQALRLAGEAYRLAGRAAPPPPELGPPVRQGSCFACHYGIEEAPTGKDSATGRVTTHADHLFKGFLSCDACHAAGAAPPGIPDSLWMDTSSTTGGPRNRAFLKR